MTKNQQNDARFKAAVRQQMDELAPWFTGLPPVPEWTPFSELEDPKDLTHEQLFENEMTLLDALDRYREQQS